jgi:hypothetical protein
MQTHLPNRLFVVAETPALLGGMAYPSDDTDWAALHERGFRRLVRLHPGEYDAAPLVAETVVLEDLYGGRAPADAPGERERVLQAAQIAAGHARRGEGVLVHCVGGTGRTGTVLACALRLLGRSADDAIASVQAHRSHWPESAWQEEVVRGAV